MLFDLDIGHFSIIRWKVDYSKHQLSEFRLFERTIVVFGAECVTFLKYVCNDVCILDLEIVVSRALFHPLLIKMGRETMTRMETPLDVTQR